MERLFIGNDHLVTLSGLKDQDGAAITSATVQATLYERDRSTEVAGVTWPLALTHVADGAYEAQLPESVGVLLNRTYALKVAASVGEANYESWLDVYTERRSG